MKVLHTTTLSARTGPTTTNVAPFRVNTQGVLAEALPQWRRLRQNLGIGGNVNLNESNASDRDMAEELAQRIMRTLGDDNVPTDSDANPMTR